MSIFDSFGVNASGMTAQRFRMDIISQNVANAKTTRTEDGTPYVRKVVTFHEKNKTGASFNSMLTAARSRYNRYAGDGVKVGGVYEDHETEQTKVYDPAHPDADDDGYVWYPNVNPITEMTNLIDATRSFEANATAFTASKSIVMKGLEIGRQ